MKVQAIRNLYPQVVTTRGDDAYDAAEQLIQYDEALVEQEVVRLQEQEASVAYKKNRADEYPPITDYIDGVVKGDQTQIDAYIAACLAVKAKYPKSE
jgi:hypothetical protein